MYHAILEQRWKDYVKDFCKANRCTPEQFEKAYIEFQESKPDDNAYRKFARKWHIRIIPEPSLPEHIKLVLSVNIAAIKVMAKSYDESVKAIEEIINKQDP